MAEQNNGTSEQSPQVDTRRELMQRVGKAAAYVAPATLALLSSKASAVS